MGRSPMGVRAATEHDVLFLAELWAPYLRHAGSQEQADDVALLVKDCQASSEKRVVVVEHDGERVGAVLLRLGTVSPLNTEACVHAVAPAVVASARRRGVGRTLLDAAASFAEDNGVAHVCAAAPAGQRDGNRFLARAGFGAVGTVRVAPTHVLRGLLEARRPVPQGANRQLGQVLAARRSMRRSRASAAQG